MKWLSLTSAMALLVLCLLFQNSTARAGIYGNGNLAQQSANSPLQHKVRIRYKRRFGRRYGRRIGAFVRHGPYASRRTLTRRARKNRRYRR